MSKNQLFIATTLDGFIARENGSLDWLLNLPNPTRTDHGYDAFMLGIDTLVMGRKTYEDVIGMGIEWPYLGCKTYVLTHNPSYEVKTADTFVLNRLSREIVEELRKNSEKNTWIVGGGEVITQYLNLDAIDEMTLCIVPLILGKGIRLFPGAPAETKFELIGTVAYQTGIVNIIYGKTGR